MAVAVEWEVLEVEDGRMGLEEAVVVVESRTWLSMGEDIFSLLNLIKSVGGIMRYRVLRELSLLRVRWMIQALAQLKRLWTLTRTFILMLWLKEDLN
jgi:hypothetical protein